MELEPKRHAEYTHLSFIHARHSAATISPRTDLPSTAPYARERMNRLDGSKTSIFIGGWRHAAECGWTRDRKLCWIYAYSTCIIISRAMTLRCGSWSLRILGDKRWAFAALFWNSMEANRIINLLCGGLTVKFVHICVIARKLACGIPRSARIWWVCVARCKRIWIG